MLTLMLRVQWFQPIVQLHCTAVIKGSLFRNVCHTALIQYSIDESKILPIYNLKD